MVNMTMTIEQPVYSGVTQYYWTDNPTFANANAEWLYLAGVVMHEFGHAWRLGHPILGSSSIMGPANGVDILPTSNDVEAMHAANDGHTHP